MIGFFEESTGVWSMTRLCAFLLTLGIVVLFAVVAVISIMAVRADPTLAVKIVDAVVAAIASMAGGMWAALRERN